MSAKKIKSAVTDSDGQIRSTRTASRGSNLLTIFSALTGTSVTDLETEYDGRGYGDLKGDLAEVVVNFVTPFRDRTLELLDDQDYLSKVLEQGRQQAAQNPRRRCATCTSRSGSCPPLGHRWGRAGQAGPLGLVMPTIGVALASGAVGEPAPGLPDLGRGHHRRHDPDAHRLLPPTEVDESRLGALEDHLSAVAADQSRYVVRLRGTARSARSHRSCSSAWPRASRV